MGHENPASNKACWKCGILCNEPTAQVRESQRAVVYVNPETGERRTPPRADMPMPEVYARQGFERQEILNMSAFEKQTGLVHEATNFHSGNEGIPTDPYIPPPPSKEIVENLAKDLAEAAASGPWTGADKLV